MEDAIENIKKVVNKINIEEKKQLYKQSKFLGKDIDKN